MDISKINDINTLKVMAYDAIAAKEQAQANLNALNQRILQLMQPGQMPMMPLPKGAQTPPKVPGNSPTPAPKEKPSVAPEEPATPSADSV